MNKTVIVGGGGHAKVVIEVMQQRGVYQPIACVSAHGPDSIMGVPVVGDDAYLPQLLQQDIHHAFVAIGDNRLRANLTEKVRQLGFKLASVISQHAIVSPSAQLADGVVIMPGAQVGTDSVVYTGVIINSNSSVDHDCVLNPHCHVAPGSVLAGGVTVGTEAFVSTGVSVIPYIKIGDRAIIGAGSVVIRDVPDDATAFGVPAHRHQHVRTNLSP